jgi:transposase
VELTQSEGLSYSTIAEKLGISKSSVGFYVKKWRAGLQIEDIRARGGQPILKNGDKQRLRRLLAANRRISSTGLSHELKKPSSSGKFVDIAPRTVRYNLRQIGFRNSTPIVVPHRTDTQRRSRLNWCKAHQEMAWDDVLFTDETSIELERCKGKIWHPKGSRAVVGKTKHPMKRMFWAGISAATITPLYPIRGTINSDAYIKLLDEKVIPWMRRKRTQSMHFQQDNAPAHVSRKTTEFFKGHRIKLLQWPPNSPDINPIENAWSLLKSRIDIRCPKPLEELEAIASEEWSRIPSSFFENLIGSMPRRIAQVIERDGGKTDY